MKFTIMKKIFNHTACLRFPAIFIIMIIYFIASHPGAVNAGPPFHTDDPEPVELHHWEFYLAGDNSFGSHGKSGTAPHFEVNYGAMEDLQLHLILPLAYDRPESGSLRYGYGDTEAGFKWRILHESDYLPQIGIFPLVIFPTGSEKNGTGDGMYRYFLPLWLQKSAGKWTCYGGGGYWINQGAGGRDYWYTGLLIQRKILDGLALGGEIFYTTPDSADARTRAGFNFGGIFDINNNFHLLFSAGRDTDTSNLFICYFALQMTF
jgi:hypothetical protein